MCEASPHTICLHRRIVYSIKCCENNIQMPFNCKIIICHWWSDTNYKFTEINWKWNSNNIIWEQILPFYSFPAPFIHPFIKLFRTKTFFIYSQLKRKIVFDPHRTRNGIEWVPPTLKPACMMNSLPSSIRLRLSGGAEKTRGALSVAI